MILFFYLHFTWLSGHKMIKEFLKNINFWKYDNTFSSELSKLTSVRNKLNLALKYWFMEAKDVCRICYGLKYWSKYHLNTINTTFSENNNNNNNWWKTFFFMPENASFLGYFTEVIFDTSVENQLPYLQNDYFSKNLWWFHEPHNQVKCR